MTRMSPLLLAVAALASATRAEGPAWEFNPGQAPLRYTVSLEHEESGNDRDKIVLDLAVQLDLKSVSPAGDGIWEITLAEVKAERNVDGRRHAFDSTKGKAAPEPLAPFAEMAGKKILATVARGGDLKGVSGALERVPSPGDFMAEGANRDKLLAEALLGDLVAKLFRLPGAGGYRCGVVCVLGNAVAGCHLSESTELRQESATKKDGVACVRRTWADRLESDGGSIRAGGKTLTLREGDAGTGQGEGIYAPGYPVSLKDKVEYEMPTASRTAKFKRTVEVNPAR